MPWKKNVRFDWSRGVWIEPSSPLALPHYTHWFFSHIHRAWLCRYVPR
jgi:hypothetical protein